MIQVDMARTLLWEDENNFIVLLRSPTDQRALPIAIGQFEAQAIAIKLDNREAHRPLTHDLLKNSLDALGCTLLRVVVCELRNDTFYARLQLRRKETVLELDARPSDALALALRYNAPVFIEDAVMEQAGVPFTDETQKEPERQDADTAPGEVLSPLQQLQKKLTQAVAGERYEDAAGLRDQIRKLSTSN